MAKLYGCLPTALLKLPSDEWELLCDIARIGSTKDAEDIKRAQPS
jgi:hypothetical protein